MYYHLLKYRNVVQVCSTIYNYKFTISAVNYYCTLHISIEWEVLYANCVMLSLLLSLLFSCYCIGLSLACSLLFQFCIKSASNLSWYESYIELITSYWNGWCCAYTTKKWNKFTLFMKIKQFALFITFLCQ